MSSFLDIDQASHISGIRGLRPRALKTRQLCWIIITGFSLLFLSVGCSNAESSNASLSPEIAGLKITSFPQKIDRSCKNGRAKLFDECSSQIDLFNEGKRQAEAENKTLLVSYGAEWCIWCHVFEAYITGKTNKFEYTYGEPRKSKRYTDTMYERAERDVSKEAYDLKKFVSDNFVVVHIDYEHSPDGEDVLSISQAEKHYNGGLPFIYTVGESGTYAAKFDSSNVETRRDTDDWYRGYDRVRLLNQLKMMHAKAQKSVPSVETKVQVKATNPAEGFTEAQVKTVSQDTVPAKDRPKPKEPTKPSQAILVLDASGSMWGKVEGRHKIEIARDVVKSTVDKWDTDIEMGLMAYGHRRKGDCSDIELLLPPKKLNAKAFTDKANALSPIGKTPLSAAVTQAAEALDYKNTKATVILVSDGKETCDLDPCAVGNALEAAGLNFTAHIISFDVPKVDAAGMQCLAENTGGIFIEAKNSDELEEALQNTKDVISEEAALDLGPAMLSFENPVLAGAKFPVEWTGPKNKGDVITTYTTEREPGGFGISYLAAHDFATPVPLTAPETPGEYLVVYKAPNGQILGEAPLTVVEALATLEPPSSVVAGSRFEVKWTGPKNEYDEISLRSLDGSKSLSGAFVDSDDKPNPAILTAPDDAGEYKLELRTRKNKVLATATVEVTPALASVKIAQEEIVAGNSIEVKWTGPGNKNDEVAVYNMDGTRYSIGGYTRNQTKVHIEPAEAGVAVIDVPEIAGKYLVVYRTAADEKILVSAEIDVIEATGWVRVPDSVTAGKKFELDWGGPENRGDRLKIFSADGSKGYHGGSANESVGNKMRNGRPTGLIAPKESGTYMVKLLTAEKRELARATLVVK